MDTEKNEEPWAMRAYEVRKMLNIGRNTLYEWCELDIIPHKRVRGTILFSRERIKEWLKNKDNEGGKS